jgi:3-dehydroquinate dehydratase I
MRSVQFGNLSVGDIPRVVGTIASFDSLQRFANTPERACDIAEIRLDEIGVDKKWLPEARRIEASGTPVILTLRSALEGGKSKLSNDERLAILRQALDHVSAVDVELKSGLAASLHPLTSKTGKALIVSFHDFQQTPPSSQVEAIIRDAVRQASVAKISTMVTSPSDVDVLKALLGRDWGVPLCVIGMGSLGASTRADFPRFGSCLTYGYLDAPVAPGQLSARILLNHLRSATPTQANVE